MRLFKKNKKEIPEEKGHIEITFRNGRIFDFDSQSLSKTKETYKEFIKGLKKDKYLSRVQTTIKCEDVSMICYYKEEVKE